MKHFQTSRKATAALALGGIAAVATAFASGIDRGLSVTGVVITIATATFSRRR